MVALLSHKLEELRSVLRLTEGDAQAMLESLVPRDELSCPRCDARKLYSLGSRRWRCAACRYSFGLLAGRWVSTLRIPARTWVIAVKAFEAGLPAESAMQLTGLSRPTLYKVLHTIRLALAAQAPKGAAGERGEFAVPSGRYARLANPEGGATGPFEKYLKIQASRHYSIPAKVFPLYLLEWELRFRRGGRPWFDELLAAVTRPARATGTEGPDRHGP